ncbi:MAG: type II secretion system F family protein [Candidatus Riflebacteria bacterium]|nr:type II secretion system F family protein [Candidatus Riflebacteria bacterium]
MPLFTYKAYDTSGNQVDGTIEAPEIEGARRKIRERGVLPFEIAPVLASERRMGLGNSDGFSIEEKARFSRQLSVFLRGGVPLARALAGMMNQEAWAPRKALLASIKEGIEQGKTLSVAISEMPNILDSWSNSIIRVGETTGRLDTAFAELSIHFNKTLEYRRRLVTAAIYPVIMLILATGVLAFLMVYLLPMIQKIFSDMQGRLPWITRLLLTISDFLRNYGLIALGGIFVLLLLVRIFFNVNIFRRQIEAFVIKIPILGKLVVSFQLESWTRNTALMIKSGIPLLETVKTARSCSLSALEKEQLENVEVSLVKGLSFSDALTAAKAYPAFLIQMIEAGEASGDLAGMLELVSAELESEGMATLEILLHLFEPILIIGIGIIVGGIMIGVLLPIYEMNKLI